MLQPVQPIIVLHLFPEERSSLLDLFDHLAAEDWDKATACPGWTVKDIGLHLLGTEVGRLSGSRDGVGAGPPRTVEPESWDSLVEWLNRWNETWLEGVRRISPRLLRELLETTGESVYQYFGSLDPNEIGGPVSWAGPQPAPVWLDIAREYTERWVHQQQIRDAVGRPGLKEPRFFGPVLDTFVRALPHTFRNVEADEGTSVGLHISGDSGGNWTVVKEHQGWVLYGAYDKQPSAEVTMDQELAWRLFTRGAERDDAISRADIEGDRALAETVFDAVSIIA